MKQKWIIVGIIALLVSAYWLQADHAGCLLACTTKQSIVKMFCWMEANPTKCKEDADNAATACKKDCDSAWE